MGRWSALGWVGLLVGGVVYAQEWERSEPNAIIATSLERAAQTSIRLETAAVPSLPEKLLKRIGEVRPIEDGESGTELEGFPRQIHLLSYREARPWLWYYPHRGSIDDAPRSLLLNGFWQDAEGLRSCLNHTNSMVRAMAIETLATLHHPADVPLLAAAINDESEAPPWLGFNAYEGARTAPVWVTGDAEQILPGRSWRKQTVGDYARRSLELMTGKHFANKAAFDLWWVSNSGGKDCLWYWQQRLGREIEVAELVWELGYRFPGEPSMDFTRRGWAMQKSARAYVNLKIEEELRSRSPEVEAKVRLLAPGRSFGAAAISGMEKIYWPSPPNLRLSRERLLELLERKDLWSDVEWNDEMYSTLVECMGIWADVLFEPADASRLMAVLEKERGHLRWYGMAGLVIGISRLLPPASDDSLNDPETQDGFLRLHIDGTWDRVARDYYARELIRVGLPQNSVWLKSLAFNSSEDDDNGINRTVMGMLQSLTRRPLTAEKRSLLVGLLLDPRFEAYWTRPNPGRGRAMDAFRDVAIKAINAYAGSELVARDLNERLVKSRKSKAALEEIHSCIGRLKSLDSP